MRLSARFLALAALVGLVAVIAGGTPASGQPNRTLYVDCDLPGGPGDGSAADPYRSLAAASSDPAFPPVEPHWLLLARDSSCVNDQPLVINRDHARVGAYGPGADRPALRMDQATLQASGQEGLITIDANDVEIHELEVLLWGDWNLAMQSFPGSDCDWATGQDWAYQGYLVGVHLEQDAGENWLNYLDVSGFYAGIRIDGWGNTVSNSVIHDNQMMNHLEHGDNDDAGAIGVLLRGSHNTVENNRFWGNIACSTDYGVDGAAVELYGASEWQRASHNIVRYNVSDETDGNGGPQRGDHHFVELGSDLTTGNPMAHNRIEQNTYSSAQTGFIHDGEQVGAVFVVTRGPGGFGPVDWTTITDNTVTMTGGHSVGVSCANCVETPQVKTISNNPTLVGDNAICAEKWVVESNLGNIAGPC